MQHNSALSSFQTDDSWSILNKTEKTIKEKIDKTGTPLLNWDINIYRGILTGFNEAFIINSEKRMELIEKDPKSAEIIRPILRGRDIKKYSFSFNNLYVILASYGSHEWLETKYPAIYQHLLQYKEPLENRGQCKYTSGGKINTKAPYPGQHHWLELDNNPKQKYLDDFSKQKITWGNLCISSQFALVDEQYYVSAPAPIIVPGSKYLLGILNSKLADWYIRSLGVTRNGGYFEYKPMFVEKLPVPLPEDRARTQIEALVDKIMTENNATIKIEYENELDELVYQLYNLSIAEIDYLRNKM